MGDNRDELEACLVQLGPERLAAELLDLADYDRDIARRVKLLSREGDPGALAIELKRRINGLKRSSRFVHYRESAGLGKQLRELVEVIEERVLPHDPAKAFELADAFVATDKKTFDRVDDSSGIVADAYRDACGTWLRAAAGARGATNWVERIYEVAAEEDYGVRERILREAAILLSEHELRRLARRYEADALGARRDVDGFCDDAFSARVRLGLVAEALRDPVLYERSVTPRGQDLNGLQRIDIARHYLEFDQPERAIAHCESAGDRGGLDRWILLAECYGRMGRKDEQIRCLWQLFESTAHSGTYEELLELLPPGERDEAEERAKRVAQEGADVQSAASFLLQVGANADAERLLMERAADLEGGYYEHLRSLASLGAEHGCPRIEMLCYRELASDILREARSRAYGHAARYLLRLEELDAVIDDYGPVDGHTAFVASLRDRHGRKYSFWNRVER